MRAISRFLLSLPVVILSLAYDIYAIDVSANLMSIDENPNVPVVFNIINAVQQPTEQFSFSLRVLSVQVSIQDTTRYIYVYLASDSSSEILCSIVGYDPATKSVNLSYMPSTVILNGISLGPVSVITLPTGTTNLTIIDNLEVPQVYLICYPPGMVYERNIMTFGYFSFNPLTSSTYSYSHRTFFLYALPIKIVSMNNLSLSDIVMPLTINTTKYISQGILKSDCSDISVSIYDPITDTETQVPFWLDPATCNTENTVMYIKVPQYALSNDLQLFVYMGNPELITLADPYTTFYWFVNFANRYDLYKVDIYTNESSYSVTSQGLLINVNTNGKFVIYNK